MSFSARRLPRSVDLGKMERCSAPVGMFARGKLRRNGRTEGKPWHSERSEKEKRRGSFSPCCSPSPSSASARFRLRPILPTTTQAAVDAAQATLDEAESRMAQINSEYEQLTAEVAELQTKIDETAAAAMEAQQAMLEGRAALGQVAVGEYRDGSSMGLLGLILDSKNFDELLRNMEYVTQIMSYQADEVAEQKERKRAFDDVSDELNVQKNEQEEALAAQEAKRAEAQSVVEDATARLEGAQEEHAAVWPSSPLRPRPCASRKRRPPQRRPRPCRRAPTPIRAIASRSSPTTRAPPITAARRVALAIPAAQDHRGIPAARAAPATRARRAARRRKVASQWPRLRRRTVPNTPNPGTTSTAPSATDNSMGVAVPKSMPNYRSYFGRTVEIVYGGQTVYATVNDCGSMGGGSRVLDLQPGVWKAFGFSSCRAWGLRTVKYRFL